jgi:hypothetical protein
VTLRQFFERYGATAAVVAVLSLLILLLPSNAPKSTTVGAGGVGGNSFNANGTGAGAGDNGAGAAGGSASGGAFTSGSGSSGGTLSSGSGSGGGGGTASGGVGPASLAVGKGPNCRQDLREKGISVYQPPCVQFSGSNGGATSRGVLPDKIVVVNYLLPVDPGTQAILQGANLSDSPQTLARSYEGLRRYFNNHFETYGREVVLHPYTASGQPTDDEAMKADAVKIANEIKAFAVIEGNPAQPIPRVLAEELDARGVICICTVSFRSGWYQERAPYVFSSLPTITEYSATVAEYIGKRLKDKPAKWAGNLPPGIQTQKRKFGLIYLEGQMGKVDPEGKKGADELVADLAQYGVPVAAEVGYLYDPGRNQADVTNLIATMKAAGVTTIIPYVDPLYPILFTREATNQQYFPEWFIAGTGLSDTTAAGRLYDQQQWAHAFGISPLWVTWSTVEKSTGYREAHHGDPTMQKGDEGVLVNIYTSYFRWLFTGIQMAGPKLTPDTFAQGMFNYPQTGGKAAAPLVYFNRAHPTAIKDFIEVWYSPNTSGVDERAESGLGMIMKVDGGKRYLPGQWPTTDPKVFDPNGAATTTDNPVGGGDFPHEQDGHTHTKRCLSCSS